MIKNLIQDAGTLRVSSLVVIIYGQPSTGKTSLAFSARRPLLLDCDGGAYRAANKSGRPVARMERWADLDGLAQADLDGYDTVVVDTVGSCLDLMAADIVERNAKMRGYGAGSLSLQGYGLLKAMFERFCAQIKGWGKDLVLIGHTAEERRGDDGVAERLMAAGSTRQTVFRVADLVGRLSVVRDGQRVVSFSPGEAGHHYCKNVGEGLPDTLVRAGDGELLGRLIEQAKGLINAQSSAAAEAEAKAKADLAEMRNMFEKIDPTRPEAFDAARAALGDKATASEKRLLLQVAKERGLAFDRKAGAFVAAGKAGGSR